MRVANAALVAVCIAVAIASIPLNFTVPFFVPPANITVDSVQSIDFFSSSMELDLVGPKDLGYRTFRNCVKCVACPGRICGISGIRTRMGRYRGIIVHCRICVIVHRLLALFLYSRSFVVIMGRLSDVYYLEKWNRQGIPLGF